MYCLILNKNHMYCLILINFNSFPHHSKTHETNTASLSDPQTLLPYVRPFWHAALQKTLPKHWRLLYAYVIWQMWYG